MVNSKRKCKRSEKKRNKKKEENEKKRLRMEEGGRMEYKEEDARGRKNKVK